MGWRRATHLHQLAEAPLPQRDKGPEQVRAGVETCRVAEPRLQVGADPQLRLLAETSLVCGQTVRPGTQELPRGITHVFLRPCVHHV